MSVLASHVGKVRTVASVTCAPSIFDVECGAKVFMIISRVPQPPQSASHPQPCTYDQIPPSLPRWPLSLPLSLPLSNQDLKELFLLC